jgi:hypothetical protein
LKSILGELQKFRKKTFLLPNLRQEASEKQAFIEGTLMALGLDPEKVTAEGKNSVLSMNLSHLLYMHLPKHGS